MCSIFLMFLRRTIPKAPVIPSCSLYLPWHHHAKLKLHKDTFDKYNEQLTAPKVEFVELDWLDHCEDRIRDKCQLRFKDLPAWVTDDIAELHWWPWTGDPGSAMIKMPGLAGVILVAVAFVFLMVSRLWRSRHNAKATKLMRAELALEEEAWKARRREEAQNWSPQSASASPVIRDASAKSVGDLNPALQGVIATAMEGAPVNSVKSIDSVIGIAVPDEENLTLTLPPSLFRPAWLTGMELRSPPPEPTVPDAMSIGKSIESLAGAVAKTTNAMMGEGCAQKTK
eukprot:g30524.t1